MHKTCLSHLALLLVLGALLLPATASATVVADPATPGPYGAMRAEYDLPKVQLGVGATLTGVRPSGDVYYPENGAGPYPVLVFLHGNHGTCTTGPEATFGLIAGPSELASYESGACTTGSPQVDAALAVDESRSYRGYDYLGELLATQGYVVVSIDVNDITAWGENGNEAGYMARVEMMSRTLDLVADWNRGGGPNGIGDGLKGRADLSRVGVMGHSRGGEGVNLFAVYNAKRPATAADAAAAGLPDYGPRYPLKAVFSLAPVDGQGGFNPDFDGVAFATALPYCDGDVFDLEGAPVFERNKARISASGHPAIQFLVGKANHNYFNTDWANDDAQLFDFGDPECVAPAGPTRLSKTEQQAVGVAMIGGFLRRYVGGETAFDPIMRGEAWPGSAADVVQTSYVAPAAVHRPLTAYALDGFQSAETCEPSDAVLTTTGCGASPNRSPTEQLSVSWAGPASLTVPLDGTARDVSAFRTLTFRAGVNFLSPLNVPKVAPRVEVSLSDASGLTRTVLSDADSTALEPPAGTTARKEILNGIRIPLASFTGIDLTQVTKVTLGFGTATPTGAIELSDIAFQEPAFAPGPGPGGSGSEGPAGPAGPAGPGSVSAEGTSGAAGPARTSTPDCSDTKRPVAGLTASTLTARRVLLAGTAADRGCAGLRTVDVAIAARATGKRCRFLTARGTLSSLRACTSPLFLRAKGTSRWRLTATATLPAGAYRVIVRTTDRAGNSALVSTGVRRRR